MCKEKSRNRWWPLLCAIIWMTDSVQYIQRSLQSRRSLTIPRTTTHITTRTHHLQVQAQGAGASSAAGEEMERLQASNHELRAQMEQASTERDAALVRAEAEASRRIAENTANANALAVAKASTAGRAGRSDSAGTRVTPTQQTTYLSRSPGLPSRHTVCTTTLNVDSP